MKPLITVVLLILGAALLEASSLEDFRVSFNELGSEIDERVKVLRAENSDAILEMNRKMLHYLGNYTVEVRAAIYHAYVSILLDERLNENPDAQRCFDWSFTLMDLYSYYINNEIKWCATYAHRETSADAQYHFYSQAHYIMRAGTVGRGRVLESFALHQVLDGQLEYLDNEYEWMKYLWNNYQTMLMEEIAGHEVRAEEITEMLYVCMQQVMDSAEIFIAYVKDDLKSCLADFETPQH